MAAVSTEIEPLEETTALALTTPMTVMDDVGMVADADGLFEVTTDSERCYIVDLDATSGARGLCGDHKYRQRDCKRIWRCRFEIGAEPIPTWVDRDDVDDQLSAYVASGGLEWSR
ncbi:MULTISPECIES: hypothetical protein [unclassified Natrinema]|uniref:hypothetical protein n=1 Tax=unclassified Natrinema TaxID=2622230 RepID=UPI00026D47D9|nr:MULTISPECIES: hypothetical protein [unclassified Natrinema]AFO59128.1 hypothetical protein NJ7G_3911 [Natrinema sp. J7-2]